MTPGLPDIGAELAGYRLESLISRGGMGVVYLAEDPRLGRKVALKLLAGELFDDERFRDRFLRESRVAASIDHPNVIPIYDAGDADGVLYIAMRYVPESDLRELLRTEGPLELDRAVAIAVQIAGALEAAHARGLVHRDVKPANVLMIPRRSARATDHVYLSDFGLAKHSTSVSGVTATGQFVGTVSYAAPEQLEGKPVDGRADIYALGCVLFEALTGRPPFTKEEGLAVVLAHLNEAPPAVSDLRPDCPPVLDVIVGKALAKSPDQRFATCNELIEVLRALPLGARSSATITSAPASAPAAGEPAAAAPPPPSAPAPPQPAEPAAAAQPPKAPRRAVPAALRSRWAVGLAVAAIAAGALALVLAGGDEGDEGATEEATVATAGTQWEPLADAPTPRQQAAGTALDGKIWLIGGLEGTSAATATTRVEAYDPANDRWEDAPDLPFALHHAVARSYRGELVVIGGWIPEGADVSAETSARVLALRDGEWVRLADLNHPRAAAAAAVVDGRLIVVGGQDDGELVPETEVFDGEAWRDAAPIPTPREHLAAATDGRYLYAVGGRELASDRNLEVLERYDPATNRWTTLPSMPVATGSFDAAITGGRLVAIGGEAPTEALDVVQAYDLRSRTWSTLPPLGVPRHGLTVVASAGAIYAIAGAQAPSHEESTAAMEVLELGGASGKPPPVGEWRELADAPDPLQQAAATVLGGRVWVLGGLAGEDGTEATAATTAYDPAIDTWTAGPDLPAPLHHAAAAAYEDELVVIGGWIPEGADLTAQTSAAVYALRDGEWVELPGLNHARAAAAAATVGDRLVVVGGQSDGELVTTTEVFDGEEWQDAAEIPSPREHLAAASDGSYLYAVGGRELSADRNSGALERYDPEADEWTALPSMPVPSGSLGAAIVGGQLVAVGGDESTSVIDAVQAFDLEAGRWAELPSLQTPRHGMGVAVLGETLYAIAGASSPGHAGSTATSEALDFE